MSFRYCAHFRLFVCFLLLAVRPFARADADEGGVTDRALIAHKAAEIELGNQKIAVTVFFSTERATGVLVTDRMHRKETRPEFPFRILLKDGSILDVGNLTLL